MAQPPPHDGSHRIRLYGALSPCHLRLSRQHFPRCHRGVRLHFRPLETQSSQAIPLSSSIPSARSAFATFLHGNVVQDWAAFIDILRGQLTFDIASLSYYCSLLPMLINLFLYGGFWLSFGAALHVLEDALCGKVPTLLHPPSHRLAFVLRRNPKRIRLCMEHHHSCPRYPWSWDVHNGHPVLLWCLVTRHI